MQNPSENLDPAKMPPRRRQRSLLQQILKPIASLKLTVALMAMGIFLILAGTVAQIDRDIWFVVREYFRTPLTWIDFAIFFPRDPKAFRISGGIPFPGGFTIGIAMVVNLLAAHAVRFRVQAVGPRLYAGLGIIVAGCLLTWEVIHVLNEQVISSESNFGFAWTITRIAATCLWLGSIYLLFTINESQRYARNVMIGIGAALGTLVGWLWFGGIEMKPETTRILWQLVQASVAALVLLLGCIFVFKKRAGIVLLHAGIGLIMANEIIVYSLHQEGVVHIREDNWNDHAIDQRSAELAIIDRSPSDQDHVTVVPASRLEAEGVISDEKLPFDIEVIGYTINARLGGRSAGEDAPHDSGVFKDRQIVKMKPVSGTGEQDADIPALYAKFTDHEGKSLGTYLLSANHFEQQQIKVGDKTYDVILRFKHRYLDYRLHLIDFRFDRYKGTSKAKSFSSLVRIDDPETGVDREVLISMNNPLRYRGSTFYQSNWDKEDEKGTILQAVTNTGWMVPYVGCMIVAVGMLAQFSTLLLRFLRHRDKQQSQRAPPVTNSQDKTSPFQGKAIWGLIVPALIVVLCGSWLLSKARPAKTPADKMEIAEFGKLPVVFGGRIQPIDTLARTSLRIISNRQEYVDEYGDKQPAIRWLLDLLADRKAFRDHQCVRIDHPEILKRLGLERRKGYLYSYLECIGDSEEAVGIDDLIEELREKRIKKKEQEQNQKPGAQDVAEEGEEHESDEFNVFDKRVDELQSRLNRITLLAFCFINPNNPSVPQSVERERMRRATRRSLDKVLAVPPSGKYDEWQPYSYANFDQQALDLAKQVAEKWQKQGEQSPQLNQMLARPSNEAVLKLREIFAAYEAKDHEKFSAAIGDYREYLTTLDIEWDPARTDFESWYSHFSPFYYCASLYVFGFVLVALSWLTGFRTLNRSAFFLILFTLIVHTLALGARIYISGRPPVTNLYSSALFIGWGCVLLGLVIEMIYRMGIGNAVAAMTGFGTLLIAHLLTTEVADHRGDTIGVLQAVLDTNFWLAAHVTVVTLGYATTILAGMLGVAYVAGGHLTPHLTKDVRREIGRMIYGTICFSLFFSFVGTVLGGLWADDSWGRFWGWDPKENGALIIVLWNAIVLHARWDGMVRDRGMAVLAVFGNVVVAWSWFGVNELGAGLHSYGFTEGVTMVLAYFIVTQLVIIAAGCLPTHLWRSYRNEETA